jgi:DNA polymerase-1
MAKKASLDEIGLPVGLFPESGIVLGDGPMPCKYMFIGEAPGYGEDKAGRPFIGASGQLFNKMLEKYTELRRSGVYVTNVVKHRPPNNRTPLINERRAYLPYLYEEIKKVSPTVIVTLGGVALWAFDNKLKVTSEHGKARNMTLPESIWSGIVVPWFHPAYALRDPKIVVALHADMIKFHTEIELHVEKEFNYGLGDEDEIVKFLLAHWGTFGFDTETTSPTRAKVFQTDEAEMVGHSVSLEPFSASYVPTYHVEQALAGILESPIWTKIIHNVKFEMKVLAKQGIELNGWEDTATAAYLLGEPRIGLKVLSRQLLGVQPETIKDVWPEGVADQPKDVAFERYKKEPQYAAADADNCARLWPILGKRLADEKLLDVYEKIEKPLTPVLARMEARGMGVDVIRCGVVSDALNTPRLTAHDKAMKVVGKDFNLGSPDQLAEVLEGLGAPLKKRTEGKNRYVVDANALRSIRDWWPEFIDPLLDYRKYTKLGAYVRQWVALQKDGRLHTSFNQAGHPEEDGTDPLSAPSTGRLSSSGPNLANIPHHRARVGEVDWGQEIRTCLVARPGMVLMSIDLSQEEPRIVAIAANDETLMRGFNEGRDIYRPATVALYDFTENSMDDKAWASKYDYQRFVGKTFFLAWYYGAGAGRLLSLDKDLDKSVASNGIALLNQAHPAREDYLDYIRRELYEHAVIESLYGRKRWFWGAWTRRSIPKGKNWPVGNDWEKAVREGANMRIQATAADILKMSMVEIDNDLVKRGLQARLVSTVYDEVVLELPRTEVAGVYELVKEIFRTKLPGLDLEVEARVGETWGYMEALYNMEELNKDILNKDG